LLDPFDFLRFDPDFSAPRVIDAYDKLELWSGMFGLLLLDEGPLVDVKVALDVGCGLTAAVLCRLRALRYGEPRRSEA
jgi:hypothetical protein